MEACVAVAKKKVDSLYNNTDRISSFCTMTCYHHTEEVKEEIRFSAKYIRNVHLDQTVKLVMV